MEKFNNKVITLSGDPASGKGTVSRHLKQYYEEKGFKVQVISVGELFRKIEIMEYKKMFPEVSDPSIEQIQSDSRFTSKLQEIDKNVDNEIAKLGAEINSEPRPEEVFIVDSRLAWKTIPDSFSVRLTVAEKTAGKRIFEDSARGKEEKYSTLDEAIKYTSNRKKEEIERYKNLYGIDLTDTNNYNLNIDTTLASIKDIVKTIDLCENCKRDGKEYISTWASPELFYPTQTVRDTWSTSSDCGIDPKQLSKLMKENGIYPDQPIFSKKIKDSSYQFVSDGHHRVYAAIMAGITLIPYIATKETDKATLSSERKLSEIYNHEGIRRPDGSIFYYEEYPTIDEKSEEHDMFY